MGEQHFSVTWFQQQRNSYTAYTPKKLWAPVASSCRRLAHLQMHVLLTPPCKFDFPILNLDQLWKLLWNHLETTLILTSPGTPRAKKTIYLKRVASIWGWLPTWLSCMSPILATRRGQVLCDISVLCYHLTIFHKRSVMANIIHPPAAPGSMQCPRWLGRNANLRSSSGKPRKRLVTGPYVAKLLETTLKLLWNIFPSHFFSLPPLETLQVPPLTWTKVDTSFELQKLEVSLLINS